MRRLTITRYARTKSRYWRVASEIGPRRCFPRKRIPLQMHERFLFSRFAIMAACHVTIENYERIDASS